MGTPSDERGQMQAAVTCDTCKNTAKHLCTKCHDRLCDSCKDIHSKSKGTFDHKVVLLTFEALTSLSGYLYARYIPTFVLVLGVKNVTFQSVRNAL